MNPKAHGFGLQGSLTVVVVTGAWVVVVVTGACVVVVVSGAWVVVVVTGAWVVVVVTGAWVVRHEEQSYPLQPSVHEHTYPSEPNC